jgi:hypothetical protein
MAAPLFSTQETAALRTLHEDTLNGMCSIYDVVNTNSGTGATEAESLVAEDVPCRKIEERALPRQAQIGDQIQTQTQTVILLEWDQAIKTTYRIKQGTRVFEITDTIPDDRELMKSVLCREITP